jgi:hypothetical protein
VAEPLELAHEAMLVALGVLLLAAVEVEFAEFLIGDIALQHVVGGDEDRAAGRHGGPWRGRGGP